MRRIATSFFCVLLSVCVYGVGWNLPIILAWDYPTNLVTTNLLFTLNQTDDVSVPATNWSPVVWVPVTDYYYNGVCVAPVSGTNYVFTIQVETSLDRQRFWYVTASNEWGQANPSNVLATDPLPGETRNLRAEKGW